MFSSVFSRNRWNVLPIAAGACWLALVGGGILLMGRYENTPGVVGAAPSDWPSASHLHRTPGLPTLVMTAHPQCPCTRASIAELDALMAENHGRLTAHVLFYQPEKADDSWRHTASWEAATAIPRVAASPDTAGAETALFGGETSGDVLLFDAAGHLVFHGGITAARGHLGPNAGHNALNDLLAGRRATSNHTPVFGCSIDGPISTPAL